MLWILLSLPEPSRRVPPLKEEASLEQVATRASGGAHRGLMLVGRCRCRDPAPWLRVAGWPQVVRQRARSQDPGLPAGERHIAERNDSPTPTRG